MKRKDKIAALTLGLFLLLGILLAPAARSETIRQCEELSVMIEHLRSEWDEQLSWGGHSGDAGSTILLANPDGSTWTILFGHGDGLFCIMASGDAWLQFSFDPEGSPT